MKKIVLFFAMLSFATPWAWSQNQGDYHIPLIGSTAPSFTAESTRGQINFPGDYGNKWKILFSHPKDFTPVCSSELLELANLQSKFDQMNVGRNLDEIVRTVEALQTAEDNIIIPANWEPGDDVMLSYLNDQEKNDLKSKNPDIYQIVWYMTLKKVNTK